MKFGVLGTDLDRDTSVRTPSVRPSLHKLQKHRTEVIQSELSMFTMSHSIAVL